MRRREFLFGSAAAVAAPSLRAEGTGGVRFLAFADIHFNPGWAPHSTVDWLDRVLSRAVRTQCDFVIHAGDLVHNPPNPADAAYIRHYNGFGRLPTYHCLGNHDTQECTLEETLSAFGLKRSYYHFDRGGFRFVVLDTNWWGIGDETVHYSKQADATVPRKNRRAYAMPKEELAWFRETIGDSPHPCVVISHSSLERERSWSPEARAAVEAIDAANAAHPGRVILAINGHNHVDYLRVRNRVAYLDLNGANYAMWSPKTHAAYTEEDAKEFRFADRILAYRDPLSAVVTLTPGGGIEVEGLKSAWYRDVTPERAGLSACDGAGREWSPEISSFKLKLS